MSIIEFYDPRYIKNHKLEKRSVIITSFVPKDKWKELKGKYERVIPIFVKSGRDELNLREIITEFNDALVKETREIEYLEERIKKLNEQINEYIEERRKLEEIISTDATLEVINSFVVIELEQGMKEYCFNVDPLVDHKKIIDALIKKYGDKYYIIFTGDAWDLDYGGKLRTIENKDEKVEKLNIPVEEILGRRWHLYCLIKKDDFWKMVDLYKKEMEKKERYEKAYNELLNAVEYESWFDEERGEEVFDFKWDEKKVEEIAKKYGLSKEEIEELKDKIEWDIYEGRALEVVWLEEEEGEEYF